jgi:hypothetical protein
MSIIIFGSSKERLHLRFQKEGLRQDQQEDFANVPLRVPDADPG